MSRRSPVSLITLVLTFAAAPPAAAGVVFRATVSPAVVSSPAVLEYGLQMVNDGVGEERFSVALISPAYGPARLSEGVTESAAIQEIGLPEIEGAGRFVGNAVNVAGLLVPCSVAGAGGHGYGLQGATYNVALPPRSTSALRVTYNAALPFWPDLDLRLRFVAGAQLTDGKRGTLPRDRKVLTPQPAIAGPVAVHLTLRTVPASGLGSYSGRRPVRPGKRLQIVGRANPAIPGQRVELRYARIDSTARVVERGSAGRPRVGADGTFRARWTPRRTGDYELWATYKSQAPGLLSDDTCPRLLRVRRARAAPAGA